jgi:group I intron endonuclease
MVIEYKIYKLIDPITSQVRYIGLTFNTLNQRLKSHRSENSKSHKTYWIKSLEQRGFKPKIELIESGIESYESACEREIYWISKFREDGFDLTNSTNGGDKNKKMSDETRLKMSKSQKERHKTYKMIFTDEIRMKISESTKLRMSNPEEIKKLKVSNKKYEESKTDEKKIMDILVQNHKEVLQYDRDMNIINEYLSVRDAARKSGIDRSNILKCCKMKVKSAGGFIWKYK